MGVGGATREVEHFTPSLGMFLNLCMYVSHTHVSYCYIGCNDIFTLLRLASLAPIQLVGSSDLLSGRGLNDYIYLFVCLSATYCNHPNCVSPFSTLFAIATPTSSDKGEPPPATWPQLQGLCRGHSYCRQRCALVARQRQRS